MKQGQDGGQLEEELRDLEQRLTVAERERDRALDELKEMKKVVDESNSRLDEAMSDGKVADVFTELNSVMESLSRSNQELKKKEMAIAALEVELDKLGELEAKLLEKDDSLEQMKKEVSHAKSNEALQLDLLSQSKNQIQELLAQVQKRNEAEKKLIESFAAQTKQLEETKILLEESKLALHMKVEELAEKHHEDKVSLQTELECVKSELELARQNRTDAHREEDDKQYSATKTNSILDEMEFLKRELKLATDAEENSKKAMDDLAIALTEVATEAYQTKEKLKLTQEESEHFEKEAKDLHEKLSGIEEKHINLLNEAREETDRFRKKAERLQFESEELLLGWNAKETGFVNCIKRAEDEKSCALEEKNKLLELLAIAENMNKMAKQENQKVRDILKHALNEANVAREAAGIARAENSQLKDVLAEKDKALEFITQENENLKISEAAALENIKELKQLLSEFKTEDNNKEISQQKQQKPQTNAAEKHQKDSKKLGQTCSFNLKELIMSQKHKDVEEIQRSSPGKPSTVDNEDDDSEDADLLRGSILDQAESPIAAAVHRKKKSSFAFTSSAEVANSQDYENLEGLQTDELESERNSSRKRAYLRRFGDILLRRGGTHRRGLSAGEVHRKEMSM